MARPIRREQTLCKDSLWRLAAEPARICGGRDGVPLQVRPARPRAQSGTAEWRTAVRLHTMWPLA